MWTASTIKLAIVVDLLTRARAGQIALTPADRQLMTDMMQICQGEVSMVGCSSPSQPGSTER